MISGTTDGKTAITVSPAKLVSTNKYKYKIYETEQSTLPSLNQKLTTGWTAWNGTDEITATNGYYIVVAECDSNNGCDKVGQTQVKSRVERTITYMDGESEITGLTPTKYAETVGATLPAEVTKEGYTFNGWYDNAELTGDAITSIGTSATGNKTFYAKFTEVVE